jgi:DNA-binding PadR family transcriptional regulator
MSLGDLEQVALLALARIRDEAYGAALAQEIEERTGRSVSPGALYTVMDRLQNKGFVESWIGDSTPERGGRRRKVYRLTPEGARELRSWYHGIQKMASGVMTRIDELVQERG